MPTIIASHGSEGDPDNPDAPKQYIGDVGGRSS